jgi:uncharacterized protein DUF397
MPSGPAPTKDGAWIKSSYSGGDNDCVETRLSNDSALAVRDSKLTRSPVQSYRPPAWKAFLDALKHR